MGGFKLGGMTLGSLFKKPETLCYPAEKKPSPSGLKGHIAIDVDLCILCGMCQRVCPCGAIEVDKKQRIWTLDPFTCIQCGSCVRACPKSCLIMEPTYPAPTSGPYLSTFQVPDPKAAQARMEAN